MVQDPQKALEAILFQAHQGDTSLTFLSGYRFVKKLGQGGFGAVFLLGSDAGPEVALKLALLGPADVGFNDPTAQARFLREIDIAKSVRHPNLVTYYNSGSTVHGLFLIMEFCNGGSVMDLVHRQGRLEVPAALNIILQALDGLAHMHTANGTAILKTGEKVPVQGFVHRDIKPDNLLIANVDRPEEVQVKVADYGMSKAFDVAGWTGLTTVAEARGTPEFMPKEQLVHFLTAKPDVDIWAMAACFYFLVTGSFPRNFSGASGHRRFSVVQTEPVVPIEHRGVPISPAIAEVINLALKEEPELHFKSANAFRDALRLSLS